MSEMDERFCAPHAKYAGDWFVTLKYPKPLEKMKEYEKGEMRIEAVSHPAYPYSIVLRKCPRWKIIPVLSHETLHNVMNSLGEIIPSQMFDKQHRKTLYFDGV